MKASASKLLTISLSGLMVLCVAACGSMSPYRGSVAKLLPQKTGNFQRTADPKDINIVGLKPEMAKGLRGAVVVRYFRLGGPPLRNLGMSAYAFESANRAKEVLQVIKEGYVKKGYKVSEEGARKRGWSTVGEKIVLTHEPGKDRFQNGETLAFWRNGSVMFYTESFSENQLEDVLDFEKSFPY